GHTVGNRVEELVGDVEREVAHAITPSTRRPARRGGRSARPAAAARGARAADRSCRASSPACLTVRRRDPAVASLAAPAVSGRASRNDAAFGVVTGACRALPCQLRVLARQPRGGAAIPLPMRVW